MLWLLVAIVVVLVAFGGVGYGRRAAWGSYYTGGIGLFAAILIVMLVLVMLGVLRL